MGNWDSMKAGSLDSATKRLLLALGNDATRVLHLINTDGRFPVRIARYAVSQIGLEGHLVPDNLLKHIGTVNVPGTAEPFNVDDHFRVDLSPGAPTTIRFVGDNFKRWFGGMTEDPRIPTTIRCSKFLQTWMDSAVITELGGEEESVTSLSEVFYLMCSQNSPETGLLDHHGVANIFYIPDKRGVFRRVHVNKLHRCGWDIGAFPFGSLGGSRVDWRIFSRKQDQPVVG